MSARRFSMAQWLLRHARYGLLFSQIAANSISGYILMRMLALRYGTSGLKDAFDIAYSVPFLIMAVSGFTFLHGIVTSRFVLLRGSNQSEVSVVFSSTLNAMMIVGVLLFVLTLVAIEPLTELLAPGLSEASRAVASDLILTMLPLVIAIGAATYISAVLIAHQLPIAMEFSQLMSRLGFIIWAVISPSYDLKDIAVLLVAFAFVGLLLEVVFLYARTPIRYRFVLDWRNMHVRFMLIQAAEMLVATAAAQISMSYLRRLATAEVGAVASFTYAMSITTPIATILGRPLSSTVGVDCLDLMRERRYGEARRAIGWTITKCLVVGSLFAAVIIVFKNPIIQILYGGGAFDSRSTAQTAALLAVLPLSIPCYLIGWAVLMPLLNVGRRQTASAVYLCSYLSLMILSAILHPSFGVVGLAWAFCGSLLVLALLGSGFVIRELAPDTGLDAALPAGTAGERDRSPL